MNPDLERLIALQGVDAEIARLREEVAALPRRVAAIETKLAGTKAQLDKAKAAIAANLTDKRKQEQAIQDAQQKISKYREQSLAVKTNEQYKALMHEIGFAEQEIRSAEDRILEIMVGSESLEHDLKAAEKELKEETAEIEKEKAQAREVTAKDEAELAEWAGKRKALREGVTANVLAQYDRVLAVRKSALAEARDHKCSVCHVMLRPQTYNEVRSNQHIIACDSCQRILHYDPSHDAVASPAAEVPGGKKMAPMTAWLYVSDTGFGPVFEALVNAEGAAQRYFFDSDTGRFLEKNSVPGNDVKHAYGNDLRRGLRLQIEPAPNPADFPEQIAPELLSDFQRQVQASEAPIEAPGK